MRSLVTSIFWYMQKDFTLDTIYFHFKEKKIKNKINIFDFILKMLGTLFVLLTVLIKKLN